jgi:sec-independent protein translocase protein TatA
MHLGTGELVMLVVIILIVFSASRMASLGNAIGKFVYSFRKASQGQDLIDVTPTKRLERARDKTIDSGEKKG